MKREQVIIEFCKIASDVGTRVFKDNHAHDCFCSDMNHLNFQFEEIVIDWIKDAIEDKIIKGTLSKSETRNHARSHK